MVKVKLLCKPDPKTQEMFDNLGREIQKTYDSMKAPFEAMFRARQEALKTIFPIQNSLVQLANDVAPTIAVFERLINNTPAISFPAFEYKETVSIPYLPPLRPASANDIAELVVKKLRDEKISTIPLLNTRPVLKIPASKTWKNIELCFKNESELTVSCDCERIGDFDYISLGLYRQNTKIRKPDHQWELLRQLAVISELGANFIPSTDNLARELKINKDNLIRRIAILSKKLRVAAGLTEDPFIPYDPSIGYKTKFSLRPESILRGNGELHRSGGTYLDNLVAEEP
jgi:hypothetical protein